MTIAPYRLGLTVTYERADDAHELLEDTGLIGPVVYEEEVDEGPDVRTAGTERRPVRS